jgi:hypothetical protein
MKTVKLIVWLSHKDGNKVSDFQQWAWNLKIVLHVHSHKETKDFIDDLKEKFPDGLPKTANCC